jgi:ribonuclease HII
MLKKPNFDIEQKYAKKPYLVMGMDEVGMGALAGPVFAAVFTINDWFDKSLLKVLKNLGINDSKQLSYKKREHINELLQKTKAQCYIGESSVLEINTVGIRKARNRAVRRAVENFLESIKIENPIILLCDAFGCPYLPSIPKQNQVPIIKGDSECISIAAASILAKVARDRYMEELHEMYPQYGWKENKGYGTRTHIEAIRKYGVTKHHRKMFVDGIISIK